jgi:hypothetical protein
MDEIRSTTHDVATLAASMAVQVPRHEPNFFIAGAARSGTTALWHYLRQHPDVFMAPAKEPSFFCSTAPPSWAVRDFDTYLSLFAGANGHLAIGEASTAYFGSEESPGLIRSRYPHARIILMLRNPVDRAYSLYRLNCSLGVERFGSFERALAVEDERLASDGFKRNNPYFWAAYLYFRSGLTASKLALFQRTFPPEQLHIILFDDFEKHRLEATRDVFRFIGVDPSFTPDVPVVHQSGFPLWPLSHYVVCRAAERLAPRKPDQPPTRLGHCFRAAYRLNLRAGAKLRGKAVKPSTRRELLQRYRDDIEQTGALLGRDLSQWLKPLGTRS